MKSEGKMYGITEAPESMGDYVLDEPLHWTIDKPTTTSESKFLKKLQRAAQN